MHLVQARTGLSIHTISVRRLIECSQPSSAEQRPLLFWRRRSFKKSSIRSSLATMDSTNAHAVGLVLILSLVTLFILWIYTYSLSLASKPGVPKGRFWQIPLVGETVTLASGSFEGFLRPRIQRYGRNFRTHLIGGPCICVTSVDKVKFVLQSPQLFKRVLTRAQKDLFAGDLGTAFGQKGGVVHRGLSRNAVRNFIPGLEKRSKEMLASWEKMEAVPFVQEVEKFAFTASCIFICDDILSVTPPNGNTTSDTVHEWLSELRDGLVALPINIPGSQYHRLVKIRKKLEQQLMHFVIRRRAEKGLIPHSDFLDVVVQAGDAFSDGDAVDLLIVLLFAGLESSATVLAWLIIELMLRPELIAALREENDRLTEERRRRPDSTITFEDIYEKLPLTNKIIQETLRLRNVASFTLREATEDVVHEGMLFPKGWKVLITWVALHKDPNTHSNPDTFDPYRFASESASKPDKYMPFAIGPNYCKGQDAFKVEAVIILHQLLAGYDFKPVGKLDTGDAIMTHWPTPRPAGAVPIIVSKRRPESKSS